ncbi:unnamed protein product [Diamesa tonsa]
MTDFDFDFDGFLLDAASLIERDKKHQLNFEENINKYSDDTEENGMSMNEMLDYCKNNNYVEENALLEAKEVIEDGDIEEINNPVSNEIIPSKEHIINVFSKDFVENIEKSMSLRVDQLKNTNYKFKFINIPSSFAEKSQEDFKQTFFNTPEMSGGSSHYSKSIERTANFGEALGNLQPMQQAFQGMHKMTFMMTLESTSSSFGSHFNTMMKNTFPALECNNQQLPILPYQQHPHPSNQLELFQPLAIKPPSVVITISSSDEDSESLKAKLVRERIKTKNANKENRCSNKKKSINDPPNVTNHSIKQTTRRVRGKKLRRKERHRARLPSESSDDSDNIPIQSRRLSEILKRQSNSDVKKRIEVNDSVEADIAMKDFKILVVDCMKNKPIHDIKDEIEDADEDVNVAEEPVKVAEESVNVIEEPVNNIEEPVNVSEEPVNKIEEPVNKIEEPVNVSEEHSIPNEDLCNPEDGNQTDDTISTITSDDEKFFFFEKYDKLRKQKRQMRLHERSIKRGIFSDYKPEITITDPVASSTLIIPQSVPVVHSPLSMAHPVASSTIVQPPSVTVQKSESPYKTNKTAMTPPVRFSTTIQQPPAKVHQPRKSKSPFKAKKKAPKRQLPNNKTNLRSKKIFLIHSSSSDTESNSSVSTITSDDVKFFEKDKYDKLREEKHALRAALRAERKKRN